MTSLRIAVVTVAYNSNRVLPAMLESLRHHEPEARLLVVDNASPEGVPQVGNAELVRLSRNLGYAGGCNVGLTVLSGDPPDFVAFLNPDVRLTGPALSEMSTWVEDSGAAVGIVTGTTVDHSGDRTPAAWGEVSVGRLVWKLAGLEMLKLRRVVGRRARSGIFTSSRSMTEGPFLVDGFVIGGAMLARWECMTDVEGFDEDFFMGWEDADLCRRARDMGWQVWQVPTSPITHYGGASSDGVSSQAWDRWFWEGADRYVVRHAGPVRGAPMRLVTFLGRAMSGFRAS